MEAHILLHLLHMQLEGTVLRVSRVSVLVAFRILWRLFSLFERDREMCLFIHINIATGTYRTKNTRKPARFTILE